MRPKAVRVVASFILSATIATALGAIGAHLFERDVYGAGSYVITTLVLLPLLLPMAVLVTWASRPLYEGTRLRKIGTNLLAVIMAVLTVITGGFIIMWLACTAALYRAFRPRIAPADQETTR